MTAPAPSAPAASRPHPLTALEIAAILAIIVTWGVNNAAGKLATETMPPLLVGALRFGEQNYNFAGAGSFLIVIVPFAVLSLVLPAYTTSTFAPSFSEFQSLFFLKIFDEARTTAALVADSSRYDLPVLDPVRDGVVAGEVGEEAQGHLGASGVVGAQEQHRGLAVADLAFHPGQGVQALAGEPFGEQRKEIGDRRAAGELVVGGVQEPFDRLDTETVAEVALQPGSGSLERVLLIDGQVAVWAQGGGAIRH